MDILGPIVQLFVVFFVILMIVGGVAAAVLYAFFLDPVIGFAAVLSVMGAMYLTYLVYE